MFTRLHLKQEPHHDSARPDDWEGRNRKDEGIDFNDGASFCDCTSQDGPRNMGFLGAVPSNPKELLQCL